MYQPSGITTSPSLLAFAEIWAEQAALHGAPPPRSAFTLDRLLRWAGWLTVLEPIVRSNAPTPDYRYRLYGSELVAVFGEERTGCMITQYQPRLVDLLRRQFACAVAHGRPLYVSAQPLWSLDYKTLDKVVAPVAKDGGVWIMECVEVGRNPPRTPPATAILGPEPGALQPVAL